MSDEDKELEDRMRAKLMGVKPASPVVVERLPRRSSGRSGVSSTRFEYRWEIDDGDRQRHWIITRIVGGRRTVHAEGGEPIMLMDTVRQLRAAGWAVDEVLSRSDISGRGDDDGAA